MSDGVELCLPWDVTDDGDDHVIASVREPVEIARIPYGQGADDVAAFIVRAANEHIGLTRALHRVEGEAQAQRARAEAAEAECARLRAEMARVESERNEAEGQCMELREALRRQVVASEGWRSAQAELDAARAEIDRLRDEQ